MVSPLLSSVDEFPEMSFSFFFFFPFIDRLFLSSNFSKMSCFSCDTAWDASLTASSGNTGTTADIIVRGCLVRSVQV